MPSFKIEELRHAVFGSALNAQEMTPKTGGEVSRMVGRRGKRSVQETETLIREFIASSNEPVTLLQICDHLDRSVAPHYRAILARLVNAGEVKMTMDYGAGPSIPRYLYSHNR